MLEDILPASYPYKIVQCSVVSDENFLCEIRVKINCEKEFLQWIKEFESKTNSSWILRNSVASSEKSRHRFSRNYLCQHSDYRKKKETQKNKNCGASLTVRIKRDTRSIRGRDAFVKEGYMCIIKINFMHSHKINAAEAWNWLPRSEESKRIFIDLFNTGMSPSAAKKYHEAMLLSESPELLANSRINPPIRWIYRIYEKWQEENFGGLNSEPSVNMMMVNKINDYREKGCIIEWKENPLSVIVITPLMQRTIEYLDGSNSLFIHSTAFCDQAKSVITMILAATKAGAVPVGAAIHESQSEENFYVIFSMLKQIWSEINPFNILNFMTEDSPALKSALHSVFPNVRQLLYLFHVTQSFWQWLWNGKRTIENSDRKPIMLLFRMIMYAKTLHEFEKSVDNFFNSAIVQKYKSLVNHVISFLNRKEEWCMLYRLNVQNLSRNINNYSEATIRVFKDIILTRLKAFNGVALMEFVINIFDNYLSKRLLDVVFGRRRKNHVILQKFLDTGTKVLEECIVGKDEDSFFVQSQKEGRTYFVDIGVCSCPVGIQGAFCKHQAAIQIKYKMFPNAPVLSHDEEKQFYMIAVGNDNMPSNFPLPIISEMCEELVTPEESDNTNSNDDDESPIISENYKEPMSCHSIATEFMEVVGKVSALLESCNDYGVLHSAQNFVKKLKDIKSTTDLQSFFDECLSKNFKKTNKNKRIKVQPTSISQNKTFYKESYCAHDGRPRNDVVTKIRKRAHFMKNIKLHERNA